MLLFKIFYAPKLFSGFHLCFLYQWKQYFFSSVCNVKIRESYVFHKMAVFTTPDFLFSLSSINSKILLITSKKKKVTMNVTW